MLVNNSQTYLYIQSYDYYFIYLACTCHLTYPTHYFKLFKKGKILQSERGVNSTLITILRFWKSSWKDSIFFGSFSKKICSKRTFPSDFIKFGSEILYLFLAEKWSYFFVAILPPIFAYLKKNWSFHWAEKDAVMCTYIPQWINFELCGFLDSNFDCKETYFSKMK